jgi:hypothetical protein
MQAVSAQVRGMQKVCLRIVGKQSKTIHKTRLVRLLTLLWLRRILLKNVWQGVILKVKVLLWLIKAHFMFLTAIEKLAIWCQHF